MQKANYILKTLAKDFAQSLGYRISQYRDPYRDIASMTSAAPGNVIFDVGANVGQTIKEIRSIFSRPIIHAFEPSPRAFQFLEQSFSDGTIHLNRCALGSVSGVQEFKEAGSSVMSSLLEPAPNGWNGKGWKDVQRRYPVTVSTIDEYCLEHGVKAIDLLKTDTQGYDLEVLKGAKNLLEEQCIRFVYIEINLTEMYENQATFDEIYRYLSERGFRLLSIYEVHASWIDALFVNPGPLPTREIG